MEIISRDISFMNEWLEQVKKQVVSWKDILGAVAGTFVGGLVAYGLYFAWNYRQLTVLSPPPAAPRPRAYASENTGIRYRVVNVDGTVLKQKCVMERRPEVVEMEGFGPYMRMECSFRWVWKFERELARLVGSETDDDEGRRPLVTFFGSNDFHHLSLSLIRRFRTPFNLVLFDNHPDWFKYYPGMHCGCWFTQAVSLPTCQQAFHFGGNSGEFTDDFGFHPWDLLLSGKIAVFPTKAKFTDLKWSQVKHHYPLREEYREIKEPLIREMLQPFAEQLKSYPLYITLDKDCMFKFHNFQNWNSGALSRYEVIRIIKVLLEFSGDNLLAMDITGEFSPVRLTGLWRNYIHSSQHDDEQNLQSPERALETNVDTNTEILKFLNEELCQPNKT